MAAVEYGECPSIHTSRLARFEYGIRVLEVDFFSPDLNWNVLRTLILSAQYGQYGYWNTALVILEHVGVAYLPFRPLPKYLERKPVYLVSLLE
ncbi:unnamed protein product [Arctogadus glacialis]